MTTRIAVFGAGGVGGYVGGYLTDAGHDVILVDFWHEHIEAIRSRGLELSDPESTVVVRPTIIGPGEVSSLDEPIDIALVTVKSYDTEWVATLAKSCLAADGMVVSLQNCINDEVIARIVGTERALGCTLSNIMVELVAPGRIRRDTTRRAPGANVFRVGQLDGVVGERALRVAGILDHVDAARATANLSGERWSKLALNAMTGGLAAATGLGARQVMADQRLRAFMIEIGVEAVQVATRLGHRLEPIGPIESGLYVRAGEGEAAAWAEIDRRLAAQGDPRPPTRISSAGQDIRRGRRTEIEFLNGFVVAQARGLGLPAPANARIVEIVRKVQRGQIPARPDTLLEMPAGA